MEGKLCVICFSGCVTVKGLEVNSSPWFAIAMTPCDRFGNRYRFQHTKCDILIEASFDFLLSV